MSVLYAKLSEKWNEYFMLFAASALILAICLGGFSIYTIFQSNDRLFQMIQLFLVVVPCAALLASFLTVQKSKTILNILIVSLVVSTLITIGNLIFQ